MAHSFSQLYFIAAVLQNVRRESTDSSTSSWCLHSINSFIFPPEKVLLQNHLLFIILAEGFYQICMESFLCLYYKVLKWDHFWPAKIIIHKTWLFLCFSELGNSMFKWCKVSVTFQFLLIHVDYLMWFLSNDLLHTLTEFYKIYLCFLKQYLVSQDVHLSSTKV